MKSSLCLLGSNDGNVYTYMSGLNYQITSIQKSEDIDYDKKYDVIVLNSDVLNNDLDDTLAKLRLNNADSLIFLLMSNTNRFASSWYRYINGFMVTPDRVQVFHHMLNSCLSNSHRTTQEIYEYYWHQVLEDAQRIDNFDRYICQKLSTLVRLFDRRYHLISHELVEKAKSLIDAQTYIRILPVLSFLTLVVTPEQEYTINKVDRGLQLTSIILSPTNLEHLSALAKDHNLSLITHGRTDKISIAYN